MRRLLPSQKLGVLASYFFIHVFLSILGVSLVTNDEPGHLPLKSFHSFEALIKLETSPSGHDVSSHSSELICRHAIHGIGATTHLSIFSLMVAYFYLIISLYGLKITCF